KWASALILPWVTLAFLYAAMYARLTRAGMLETMGEDYIRTARAKGLPERTVITRHALRASLTPVLTIFGLDVGLLFGGAILTEQTFSLKGLGNLALEGVIGSDLPVVLGTVVTLSLAVIVMNLVVDVMYAILDPRVGLSCWPKPPRTRGTCCRMLPPAPTPPAPTSPSPPAASARGPRGRSWGSAT